MTMYRCLIHGESSSFLKVQGSGKQLILKCLFQDFQSFLFGDDFVAPLPPAPRQIWPVQRHFYLPQLGKDRYWNLVVRSQGCCSPSYNTQDRPYNEGQTSNCQQGQVQKTLCWTDLLSPLSNPDLPKRFKDMA